ncbi:MAG TPA: class I SAM-dependent methyltransferase [Anaerolineales bacterium]
MARTISNLLVNFIHDREFLRAARQHLRGRLLDIGCGEKPYGKMLAPLVVNHIGVDHPGTLHTHQNIDTYGTAYALPVASNSFDSAISTAVLEHLEEPEAALRECFRVLKPGSTAIYTVPFIWHIHEEPRDFYRFSEYGLRYLIRKIGFEEVSIRALSGFWVTFGQLLVYNLYRLNRGPIRWFHLLDPVGLLMQLVAYLLDLIDRSERWTWMYIAVARKPAVDGS